MAAGINHQSQMPWTRSRIWALPAAAARARAADTSGLPHTEHEMSLGGISACVTRNGENVTARTITFTTITVATIAMESRTVERRMSCLTCKVTGRRGRRSRAEDGPVDRPVRAHAIWTGAKHVQWLREAQPRARRDADSQWACECDRSSATVTLQG